MTECIGCGLAVQSAHEKYRAPYRDECGRDGKCLIKDFDGVERLRVATNARLDAIEDSIRRIEGKAE